MLEPRGEECVAADGMGVRRGVQGQKLSYNIDTKRASLKMITKPETCWR